ncbi:aminotransferase-like domain-containing protein [Paraburkholderia phenoliruptrix]|uniref:GntR family transcriptional regulator n=2 Tax=Paraburkholderia phenoliruptrix TaxID=252970 RepID=K0E1W0_9BURK|nr:aminotransferase class I/II-fold pyridoxal phosphate-dependent enzyme [Paraburkholderia phenoliruptrix]AFT90463.1 GntR family transcriptional regulator [Paraburkholderia phenoliruptrix BR3459a]CAB4051873.1 Vitamin B6 salvage pathway transcriptional repressor PtsJ [Paraburkholderia phenoliruptrix]
MDVQSFVEQVSARTMRGIALEVAELIRSGAIPVGTQLPPVRDLAEAFGVSPATISGAWKQLRTVRMVSGGGRTGTWVRGDQTSLRPARYEDFANYGENIQADLRFASPDPELLPDLRRALAKAHLAHNLHSYVREPISLELKAAIAGDWPYKECAFTAINGGYDGLHAALQMIVVPGATVAIEDPTTLRAFDILEKLGARVIGVDCDSHGPLPESLAAALQQRPVGFVYQPGSHSLTGNRVSATRLNQLRKLLTGKSTMIIELDGLAGLASAPPLTLGSAFPERTVHIRTFSKSLGTDFRLAVLSSSEKFADQIQAYRNFREGWTSRILQCTAAALLTDPGSQGEVAAARETYAKRRAILTDALAERGITVAGQDTLCIWLPVSDQQYALVTLAARGIAVQPGSRFQVTPRPHIRVATSFRMDQAGAIADGLAQAVGAFDGPVLRG